MSESLERMTGPEVIQLWKDLTGQEWRLLPCIIRDQACEFGSNFTRADMEIVVQWTRAQIKAGRGGFNGQSLTWRVLAEDNWLKFQDRLAAARAWKRPAAPAPLRVVPDPQPAPAWDEAAWAKGAQDRAAHAASLLRKGAG